MPGGRSTYGICFGVLSWLIREGEADGIVLDGLAAAFAIRYSDDEAGSPWTFVVYVDERGNDEQRTALAEILTGRRGGELILKLPWVRKPSELVDVRPAAIDLRFEDGDYHLRVGSTIELDASRPFETDERVSCVIPGHHIAGREYYADRLTVTEDPFSWDLSGNCAFVSTFAYSG